MRKLYRLLLLLLICSIAGSAFGQQSKSHTISGTYTKVSFHEFVRSVEQQTPLRFYYEPATLDSLTVTLKAD
ncbi:MAG: hypothetical protein LPK03_02335, partial [Pontibacter sp.]|nr:hypothetical protein [Pontibacter sp.]